MASTLEGRRLTEAHRLAQARLGADTVRQVVAAFPLLDGEDLDGTLERWLRVVLPTLRSQRSTSAALAANYLTTFRSLEIGMTAGRFIPALADSLPVEAATSSLIVTGPASIKSNVGRGVPLPKALDLAKTTTARAAMRHVMDGGRETILEAGRNDSQLIGHARVAGGNACAFCAMLASRGPVYRRGGGVSPVSDITFASHDGCSCSAEPVYRDNAAWPAGSTAHKAKWDQATALARDEDIRPDVAFRRLVEGRA